MKDGFNEDFVPRISSLEFRKCTPDWGISSWAVDGYDITFVVKGKGRFTVDGKAHDLNPGDLLFLTDRSEKQAATFPHDLMHCYSINFNSLYPASKIKINMPMLNHIGLRQDIIDLFQDLCASWAEQQNGYVMRSRALLMLILHRLLEILVLDVNSAAGDYRINRVISTISAHYMDKLTVKELAEQIHLDESYFGRLFKKETGMTVNQFINKVRVQNAEALLQSGEYKVYEAAEQCGFSDVVHFYKSFRGIKGFSPSRCIPRK
jgi:AraC-like DNA-binding protein